MSNERNRLRQALAIVGTTLVVVLSLPLLVLMAFMVRALAPFIAGALVVGVVLYAANPRFRGWFAELA